MMGTIPITNTRYIYPLAEQSLETWDCFLSHPLVTPTMSNEVPVAHAIED
jgi:hypothetical protein